MKVYKSLLWPLSLTVFVMSCEKEYSYEKGASNLSSGSLQSGTTGDCLGSLVAGTYKPGISLADSNHVDVKVDITTVGSYMISTDTINGFYFSAAGSFTATGENTVRLQGNGKPHTVGTNIFIVTYDSTQCTFSINVSGVIDYFPRAANSNWSYKFDNNPMDTLFKNVISQTRSAMGNTYNVFMFNDGSGTDTLGYFRKASGDYYEYLDVAKLFGLDHDVWGEYIFLKDNAAAGTSWTSSQFTDTYTTSSGTVPMSVRFKETIQQKDIAVTVQGTTYQNTIVVLEESEYSLDGGATWSPAWFSSTNYYTRNVGLIKLDFVDRGVFTSTLQELTRSEIF